jgi:hypothetical protein
MSRTAFGTAALLATKITSALLIVGEGPATITPAEGN